MKQGIIVLRKFQPPQRAFYSFGINKIRGIAGWKHLGVLFYGIAMKKPQNSIFTLRSCECANGRFNNKSNGEYKNKNGMRLRGISVIWLLVFFFSFGVCLSDDGNGDYLIPNGNISLSKSIETTPVKLNVSINLNVTTNNGYKTLRTSCLLPGQSRVEDLAFYILGEAALVCESPFELQIVTYKQRSLESHHDGYLDLDEFRNTNRQGKKPGESNQRTSITHRVELDGSKYNYASLAKGAKVVAHNKEAKGAGNILGKDHDKYLINPCSAGQKFVVVELAEETLVDTVKLANFEHHSCIFKEFELLGSLTYPTETWSFLGRFTASNVKQAQTFTLPEPKWVSYLNLSLISHYGSEHYCTLSLFEVYGIDAIERMLEDLMVVSEEPANFTTTSPSNVQVIHVSAEGSEKNDDENSVNDHVPEAKQKPSNRIPGDTVLKILLQKVRSLDLNLATLEEYLRELSHRQGEALPVLDKQISKITENIENGRKELMELLTWKETMAKETEEMEMWKDAVSSKMRRLMDENRKLRSEIENVAAKQSSLESREFAVVAVNLLFMCVACVMLVSRQVQRSLGGLGNGTNQGAQPRSTKGWMLILFSSCLTMLIGLLSF